MNDVEWSDILEAFDFLRAHQEALDPMAAAFVGILAGKITTAESLDGEEEQQEQGRQGAEERVEEEQKKVIFNKVSLYDQSSGKGAV